MNKNIKTKSTLNTDCPQVYSIKDTIVKVIGKFDYYHGQIYRTKLGKYALVLSAEHDWANLIIEGNSKDYVIGDCLYPVDDEKFNIVSTNKEYFGKIIDVSGSIIYPEKQEKSELDPNKFFENKSGSFSVADHLMKRTKLDKPLETGIYGIDLLIPIGKGQRQLILGDRKTGKTHIALSIAINQAAINKRRIKEGKTEVKIVYTLIGQSSVNVQAVYNTLKENNALKDTIIIEAKSSNSFHQFLIPYVAMAHAENISHAGQDVIIVYDDLTKHANIYREMSLLINKSVGREAYPGDIFYVHSRVLERAGNFKPKNGKQRGSITCIPIVETVGCDITALIPSNTISITDGQIVLTKELFALGEIPAVDFDLSVSRTGTSVQSHHLSQEANEISKIYSAFKRNERFSELQSDFSSKIDDIVTKGKILKQALIQKGFNPYDRWFMLVLSKMIIWKSMENFKSEDDLIFYIKIFFIKDLLGRSLIRKINREDSDYKNDTNTKISIDDALLKNFIYNIVNHYIDYKNLKSIKKFAITLPIMKYSKKQLDKYWGGL